MCVWFHLVCGLLIIGLYGLIKGKRKFHKENLQKVSITFGGKGKICKNNVNDMLFRN